MSLATAFLSAELEAQVSKLARVHGVAQVAEADAKLLIAGADLLGEPKWADLVATKSRVLIILSEDSANSGAAQIMTTPTTGASVQWIVDSSKFEVELAEWLVQSVNALHTVPLEQANRAANAMLVAGASGSEKAQALDLDGPEFLRFIAHELNTPLTPIKMQLKLADILAAEIGNAQLDNVLSQVNRSFSRLEGLIKDIVESMRLGRGRAILNRQHADVRRLVENACNGMMPIANSEDIELECTATAGDYLAFVDAKRVEQVFDNLLSNAVKYAGAGSRINVELERNRGVVRVRISDDGAGISAEGISHLFRPFSRVHDQAKNAAPGTGLGLYICKGIADAHGGKIWAESDGLGLGTTFVVDLPTDGN